MIKVIPSSERGQFDHGWLETRHSFSFAKYFNPARMGFRALRVFNEDILKPGKGIDMHEHRNMEIFTYVLSGQLKREDELGNKFLLNAGEIHYLTSGGGISHSDKNPSKKENCHYIEFWIYSKRENTTPRYAHINLDRKIKRDNESFLIASKGGKRNSLNIRADAKVYMCKLKEGKQIGYWMRRSWAAWLFLLEGELDVNDYFTINAGDSCEITKQNRTELVAKKDSTFLYIKLA